MATLTIRNFDDDIKAALRLQAARNGCSMEQEVRDILRRAVGKKEAGAGFASRIQQRFVGMAVDELPVPPRRRARAPAVPKD